MTRVRVKICGITSTKILNIAVNAGVDSVGFVVNVPNSPRNISIKKAKTLIKSTPVYVEPIVVTAPLNIKKLKEIYLKLQPCTLQIHGSNIIQIGKERSILNTRIIGAVNVDTDNIISKACQTANQYDAVIIDSNSPGLQGGTGITHNWKISKLVKATIHPTPLILAGGLNPENVSSAIKEVKPYAVDVSSGVEKKPGVKDPEKIFKFVKKVIEAN
jgi:phosphoribosylanthranilate isomerase